MKNQKKRRNVSGPSPFCTLRKLCRSSLKPAACAICPHLEEGSVVPAAPATPFKTRKDY
jgi:hypothetical protein